MAPRKPSGPTKQERVYAAIRERILRGTYGPAYRVVIELAGRGVRGVGAAGARAIRGTVFLQIPYRGSASVAEHRALIELLASHAPPDEIETAAREHKLNTVASFREWELEHDTGAGAGADALSATG
jgi:DNA-binding GntR family transcriptional regulator